MHNSLSKLTIGNLLNTYSELPQPMKYSKTDAGFMICSLVVKHFLGIEWLEKNVYPHPTKGGILRLDADKMENAQAQAFRVIDLAELLINLQNIEGFDQLIYRMKTHDPESYLAELRVGRILYINDAHFRFITPGGKKGDDYDLEIIYPDGMIVCAETKCKIEGTEISAATIKNALGEARGQLPQDKPGVIFVMVPQRWLEEGAERLLVETAIAFLKGTGRVASVKYYVEPLAFSNGTMSQGHKYKEISNPHHRLYPNRNWDLLHYKPTTTKIAAGWDALPEKWIRLINFPHELGTHENLLPAPTENFSCPIPAKP